MSTLSRLARLSRSVLSGRPGGLGTRRQQPETVRIAKPPIERGQGIGRSIRRRLEEMGLRSREQRVPQQELQEAPVPPPFGPTPPPPPPPPVPPGQEGSGRIPPPFPSGRRADEDEWIAEWYRRRAQEQDEPEDEIEVLGRGIDYDEEEFQLAMEGAVQVASSNVYSYYYQPESKYSGVLYVTFLAKAASKNQPRQGPGPTYAYYGVTVQKYRAFRAQAAESAGSAVWDHLRVRGTIFGHQVQYRLISVTGDYVPRKATAKGFKTRYLKPVGRPSAVNARLPANASERERELQRRGFMRSTLPPQDFATPERGNPDRGTPNRG